MWDAIRWLHLLAMAFFVGGQIFLAATVLPALRDDAVRDRLRAIARNFGYGSLVAIGVLLLTGMWMADHFDRWDDGALQAKLVLVALVGILVGWHVTHPESRALDGPIFIGSLAIVALGVVVAH